ncbi:MAG: transglycosylase SLT domain-containing protein [Clostridia bacterium]|nr:transglycosylase SLT domain-containing protein [Clostridia bacterium]
MQIFENEDYFYPDVEKYATIYNLPPALVMAVISQESAFNPFAKRYENKYDCYSYGLMQILYVTAKDLGYKGEPEELLNINNNLNYGCKYLAKQYKRYNQNLTDTISSYNAGSVNKTNDKYSNQDYVNKVLSYYLYYNAKYVELNEEKTKLLRNMILNKEFSKIVNLEFGKINEKLNKDNILPILLIAIPIIIKLYRKVF